MTQQSTPPAPPDDWYRCQAETLADALERIDKVIFYHPLELATAGEVRVALAKMIHELRGNPAP